MRCHRFRVRKRVRRSCWSESYAPRGHLGSRGCGGACCPCEQNLVSSITTNGGASFVEWKESPKTALAIIIKFSNLKMMDEKCLDENVA